MKIFRLAKLDAELYCHACQFKLQNVSRTGNVQWKNLTVFFAISRISGMHDYLPNSCFVTEFE
jgi:hypothetical protein